LQIEFDLFQPRLAFLDFGGGEFLHFRVGKHLLGIAHVLLALLPGMVLRHHRRKIGMLARQLAIVVHVAGDIGAGKKQQKLFQPLAQGGELGQNRRFHLKLTRGGCGKDAAAVLPAGCARRR
jgi:hypothetical protein